MEWSFSPLIAIAIFLAFMFFGYFFGLIEGRNQGYNRHKGEEQAQKPDQESLPTDSPAVQASPLPDDFVADTPSSDRSNGGCPSYPTVHCRTNDMTMNYMDYVYDDCMYMFTNGQNDRMRALFAEGGERVGFVN